MIDHRVANTHVESNFIAPEIQCHRDHCKCRDGVGCFVARETHHNVSAAKFSAVGRHPVPARFCDQFNGFWCWAWRYIVWARFWRSNGFWNILKCLGFYCRFFLFFDFCLLCFFNFRGIVKVGEVPLPKWGFVKWRCQFPSPCKRVWLIQCNCSDFFVG